MLTRIWGYISSLKRGNENDLPLRSNGVEGETRSRIEEGIGIHISYCVGYDLIILSGTLDDTRRFNYPRYILNETRPNVHLIMDFHKSIIPGTGAMAGILYLIKNHNSSVRVTGPAELMHMINITEIGSLVEYQPSLDELISSSPTRNRLKFA